MPFTSESAKKARKKSKGNTAPPEIKAIRQMEAYEIEKLWFEINRMSMKEAIEIIEDKNTPLAKAGMISFFLNLMKTGDNQAFKTFLERHLGKVPDAIDFTDRTDELEEKRIEEKAKLLLEIARKPK